MINKTKLLAPALVASLMLGAAAPASAASVNIHNSPIREIAQLDRKIDRALLSRQITRYEAVDLERQVDRLRRTYRQFARGGLNRKELRLLDRQIASVELQLKRDMYDRDGRKGGKWNDIDGRNGHRR